MSAVGDTSASSAAASFGNTVLSVVRKVFSGNTVRWRSTSVSETSSASSDVIDRSTSSTAESIVVGNAGSDLNGNDSLSSFNSTKCLLGDAALRSTVCPRCGCSLTLDPVHTAMTVGDKLKPFRCSAATSCIRCGWMSSAEHTDTLRVFTLDADGISESIEAGEPVCVCSACSRARTAMIGSSCDSGADSASSGSSTMSLVMDFSSSSDVSSAPVLPSSGPRPLSTGKHRKTRHVTTTQILQPVPASNRFVRSAVGSQQPAAKPSPSMPTTTDIYFLPPHIAVSRDGEEGFARSQRRLARLNRVVDSNSVLVPPNRTVRHITGFDT